MSLLEVNLSHRVAIHDATRDLPRHATKKYALRDSKRIGAIVVHKTGADGPPGLQGMIGCANFAVQHRGWPGFPYTYWLPRSPDTDTDGRLILYRGNADDVRSYHTGGHMNAVGVGIGVQGTYDGEWDLTSNGLPKTEREPTTAQWAMLEALVDHLRVRHSIVPGKTDEDADWGLTGHWEHGKPICPGDALRLWVMRKRGELPPIADPEPSYPSWAVDARKFDVKTLQHALNLLGYDAGIEDGLLGYRTRSAIERMQRDGLVTVDGWYGPRSAQALQRLLERRNLAAVTNCAVE